MNSPYALRSQTIATIERSNTEYTWEIHNKNSLNKWTMEWKNKLDSLNPDQLEVVIEKTDKCLNMPFQFRTDTHMALIDTQMLAIDSYMNTEKILNFIIDNINNKKN